MTYDVDLPNMPTQSRLRLEAVQDELTRLLNLRALRRAFASRASRHEHPFTLVLVDLDRFKEVNDVYGHAVGDRVLEGFARLFRECVGLEGTAYRVGGDEFVGVLEGDDPDDATTLEAALRSAIDAFEEWPGVRGFSLGWARFPHEGTSLDELRDLADSRMYARKGRRGI